MRAVSFVARRINRRVIKKRPIATAKDDFQSLVGRHLCTLAALRVREKKTNILLGQEKKGARFLQTDKLADRLFFSLFQRFGSDHLFFYNFFWVLVFGSSVAGGRGITTEAAVDRRDNSCRPRRCPRRCAHSRWQRGPRNGAWPPAPQQKRPDIVLWRGRQWRRPSTGR